MAAPKKPTTKKTPTNVAGLKMVQPMTWAAIWRRWSREEGRLKKWRHHFQRQGFRSWSDWRQAVVVSPFGLARRQWTLYEVVDPRVISKWSGGPFPRWVAGPYKGAQTRTFGWLASAGRANEDRKKTKSKKLPTTMFLFGLIYRGRIVVLDGMHRSVAVAERVKAGQRVGSTILIALARTETLPRLKVSLK